MIDASVLTDYLLARPVSLDAVEAALDFPGQEALHAPELIEPEVLSALRRLALTGAVSSRRASEAVADLAGVRMVRYPHAPLRDRVWALRDELTAYDATYLALAEGLEDADLLTADRGLAARAVRSLGAERVRLVD